MSRGQAHKKIPYKSIANNFVLKNLIKNQLKFFYKNWKNYQ